MVSQGPRDPQEKFLSDGECRVDRFFLMIVTAGRREDKKEGLQTEQPFTHKDVLVPTNLRPKQPVFPHPTGL